MNFVVIGTDHGFQERDPGLEGLLRAFVKIGFIEPPLSAIGEEYGKKMQEPTIAKRVADDAGLGWFNIDMSIEEREAADILEDQRSRPISTETVCYRVSSDEIREEEWVRRLTDGGPGTVIVVCGYLHSGALAAKLRLKGHAVDHRVYLQAVPEIRSIEQ